jgi:hypothetical protein
MLIGRYPVYQVYHAVSSLQETTLVEYAYVGEVDEWHDQTVEEKEAGEDVDVCPPWYGQR